MTGVADKRDRVPPGRIPARLRVDLGDERADGVDDLEATLRTPFVDLRCDPVSRQDDEWTLCTISWRT